jgi:hypothetical protein
VESFARAVWGAQTLCLYIYALFDDNRHIGFAEGAVAFLTFCAAVPGSMSHRPDANLSNQHHVLRNTKPSNPRPGRLNDHFSRDLVVRFTALFPIVAFAFVLVGIVVFHSNNVDAYAFVTAGLAVWGFFNGMMVPALQVRMARSQ